MKVISRTRYCFVQCLVFSFCITSCFNKTESPQTISIQWKDSLATGFIFSKEWFSDVPVDSLESALSIHVIQQGNQPPVFGDYLLLEEIVVFQPLVPFTRGLLYDIRVRGQSIDSIKIPPSDSRNAPEVLSAFPTQDTVPNNLLKVYLHFSKPMREDAPLRHVVLIHNQMDTLPDVFLDLQPALWNKEGTLLTLWIDPGRVKRDPQPNQNIGPPLQKDEVYTLFIKNDWEARDGSFLKRPFRKEFVVGARDSISPEPDSWTLEKPQAGTRNALKVKFHESQDYVVLKEAVHFRSMNGNISGEITLGGEESMVTFIPLTEWESGDYFLECESRLEDLAGNNLNRLFDRDITLEKFRSEKEHYRIKFSIN
ncbi:MAG: hypothetical protein ABIR06_16855 [Cyclobacteriaceae bacterium]